MNNCLAKASQWTWDWPLDNEDGEVHCRVNDGRFTANFVFADFRTDRGPVYSFDNLKSFQNSYSIMLCPIKETDYPVFCRLEIQAIPVQQSLTVEAYRELFRYEKAVGTNMDKGSAAQKYSGPLTRKTRKVYRLPDHVKMDTMRIRVGDKGRVVVEAEVSDF